MAREPGAAVAEPSAHRFPQSEQRSFPEGIAGGRQQAAQRAGRAEGEQGLGAGSGSLSFPLHGQTAAPQTGPRSSEKPTG